MWGLGLRRDEQRVTFWKEASLLGVIILLGALLRIYRLGEIPPGIHYDEAHVGVLARRLLEGGNYPIFFRENYGVEPLYVYLVALSFKLFGEGIWAIRIVSALVGISTIAIFYLLVRELLSEGIEGAPSPKAFLAAFWLSTSYWHLIYSRFGVECILLPLLSLASFYSLWRGFRSGGLSSFIWSGFFLGASLYTYQSARFLPFLFLIFLGYQALKGSHRSRLLLLLVIALLVSMPLGIYALSDPDLFFARAAEVSIFSPGDGQGSIWRTLIDNLLKTGAMFVLRGDPNPERNPALRPILDPFSAIFFVIGLAIALWRWRVPAYLFSLLWLLVLSLPGVVTVAGVPHFGRTIGALPVVYILCTVGLVAAWDWLKARSPSYLLKPLFWFLLSLFLLFATVFTYTDFFLPWETQPELRGGMSAVFIEAAEAMNQLDEPGSIWLLPMNSLADPPPESSPSYPIDFLYQGHSPHHFLPLDDGTIADELTPLLRGVDRVFLVSWKGYDLESLYFPAFSDPKGLLPFLLEKYGAREEAVHFRGFDILIYRLPEGVALALADSLLPLSIDFGGQMGLEGGAFGGVEGASLPSGRKAWVVLQWRALRRLDKDYKVSIRLLDAERHLVGQVDKLLLSNYLEPTSEWEPGQVEIDYYTLPTLPATPPGEYQIEVTAYDRESLESLPILGEMAGQQAFTIGTLQIVEPLLPPEVEPQVWLREEIAPGIRLLGYDLAGERVAPGEEIALTLYWEALEDVASDYLFSLQLQDGEGWVRAEEVGRPVDGRYPTPEWERGEVIRDWHKIRVEAGASQGTYTLSLKVMERGKVIGEAALATIIVGGRPHRFAMPPIQYPLQARLGESIKFLGYDLSAREVKAGGVLELTLYWQALSEMERSYTVFVHLLDERNQIWGQKDTIPGGGSMLTTGWVEGEVITDRYEIMVMPEAPAGRYLLECGVYLAQTGERLPVFDMAGESLGDRLLLPIEIEVSP